MKIHQLPIGVRFEYEGEEYVKTAPLFASGKAGQRLIPRYAVLKPLGEAAAAPQAQQSETLPRRGVLAAFEAFYATCESLVVAERRAELAAARGAFIKALDAAP